MIKGWKFCAWTPSSQLIFVARQPILDEARRVFGYELLYRAALADTSAIFTSNGLPLSQDTRGALLGQDNLCAVCWTP